MTKIVYDMALLQCMRIFDALTHAQLKDCFLDEDTLFFVVAEKEMGKAIGKQGITVKKLSERLNRKIKIVEFNSSVAEFTKNALYPLRVADIEQQDDVLMITPLDNRTRGMIIGPNAVHLRLLERIVQRYFPIKEIKVKSHG